jgi:cytochrome c
MSRSAEFARALLAALCALPLMVAAAPASEAQARAALGRAASPAELRAWDIDVRADFTGLPPGRGTVAQGQRIWDGKCASCHGDFGESNEVFAPIVGGTTADDIARGRVAGLTGTQPYRTTLMKLSTVSTLWDYIRRAMPWDAPKSLSPDEVYAVTAYILHLGDIVPADYTLSNANIAEVQRKLPNRDGMTREHGLWPGRGRPDTRNTACMKDCATSVSVTSSIPDYARDAHGDLATQQRPFGPVRGIGTATGAPAPATAPSPDEPVAAGLKLARQYQCVACHGVDRKLVGPSFVEIGRRYQAGPAQGDDVAGKLAGKIKAGGQGAWGSMPMPAQPQVPEADLQTMVRWILEAK